MLSLNIDPALFNEIEHYAQAISQQLLEAVTQSAEKNKVSAAEKNTTKILATFAMPHAFGFNKKVHEILINGFQGRKPLPKSNKGAKDGFMFMRLKN